MTNIIRPQIDCSSAKEFLDAVSPISHHFQNSNLPSSWLFRGQGQDYPLVPSLYRNTPKLASLTYRNLSKFSERIFILRDLLGSFFEIADKRGLMLPDDSQKLRSTLETLRSKWGDNINAFGYDGFSALNKLLSLEALAQHYGVPTRLMDWTRHPFIGAFFAGEDALNKAHSYDGSTKLVIWAFYFPLLGKHYELSQQTDPLRIVTAPSATNPNLKAQQGVFTLVNYLSATDNQGQYIPIDQMLAEKARAANPAHSDSDKLIVECQLRKFTLPVSEASELLYLLAKLDITASAIYPGYQHILDDIQLQNLWSKM